MTNTRISLTALGCTLAIGLYAVAPTAATSEEASASPLRLASSRVSIAGTSNIHAYTASSTAARVVRLRIADSARRANVWEDILKPGVVEAFEISIPAATLTSPRDGVDKNMHKALKVTEHPDITFRLARFESAAPGTLRAVGMLTIAGVEREVTLELKTQRSESTLTVSGDVQLLMTDFGITPPKAMLGMLKTDPKVTVTFETALGIPLT
jgi:polyisoprenoid-binding protein YceI